MSFGLFWGNNRKEMQIGVRGAAGGIASALAFLLWCKRPL